MADRRPILVIDFDGVIHDYRDGWKDGAIYGDLTPGFGDWLPRAAALFDPVVMSSRGNTTDGVFEMQAWLLDKLGSDLASLLRFSMRKPPAFLSIDDRCVTFKGEWHTMEPEQLLQFRPWMVPPS